MRRVDEAAEPLGVPMVTPRLLAAAVHALLNHPPAPVIGDNEAMQVQIEPVLHRRAVDLCDQPARASKGAAIQAGPLTYRK
jgi:hypothetical protein